MMIERKYGLTEYGELINEETGRVYTVKGICAIDLCYELNELYEENKRLYCLVTEILDYIEDNNGVTVEEMKKWWRIKEKQFEMDMKENN